MFTKREFLDNGICIIGKITCTVTGETFRQQLFYKDFGNRDLLISVLHNNINYFKAAQLQKINAIK